MTLFGALDNKKFVFERDKNNTLGTRIESCEFYMPKYFDTWTRQKKWLKPCVACVAYMVSSLPLEY